jgi:hypothetical protein
LAVVDAAVHDESPAGRYSLRSVADQEDASVAESLSDRRVGGPGKQPLNLHGGVLIADRLANHRGRALGQIVVDGFLRRVVCPTEHASAVTVVG